MSPRTPGLHASGEGETRARLTWSLAPHSPAEGIAVHGFHGGCSPPSPGDGLAPSPARSAWPARGPEPPHPWAVPARQDLHLNRTMLDDQGSPYVGRFACGWHRLPENLSPGNHRPERGSGASIARPESRPDRARGDEYRDVLRPGRDELRGARRGGGARREDVVDQQHVP